MSSAIAKLNERVERKAAEFKKVAKSSKTEVPPEVLLADRPASLLWAGSPIYQPRSHAMVYVLSAIGAAFFFRGVWCCGLPCAALCLVATYLIYDAYSGVLHVALDDPHNLSLPIIGQPCLEFQWHHHISDDIVAKPFIEVCGDLNFVVGANLAAHFFTTAKMGGEPLVLMLLGLKMVAAYFGQFSHRSAHMGLSQRGPFITKLQSIGIMTTFAQHHVHHTPPHDSNFCLLGPCNAFVQLLATHSPGSKAWLALFIAWTFFDITLMSWAIGALVEGGYV